MLEYIKRRQKQLEARTRRVEELEAKKEAERVAIIEEEARKQKEIAARKKLLLEQQEAERVHQEYIQAKEKLTKEKWNKQLNTLLAQEERRKQEHEKLEEIKIIIQNRESALQELNWDSWLTNPVNQKLADLDYDHAQEIFNRDNEMVRRRRGHGTRGYSRRHNNLRKKEDDYILAFAGNTGDAAESYVTTDFNPDTYNLNLGMTVSYWVRPDEVGNTMFAFGRKHSGTQRFVFGINRKRQGYFALGSNKLTTAWVNMDTPVEESLLEEDGAYWNLKTDGTWYHFVVTYDDRSDTSSGADRKVYVNGVLRHTNSINWSTTGGGTGGMYFGGRNLGGTGYNNGWACALSHVAIFDTAKDADWVTIAYNNDRTGTDFTGQRGLVGYWKFNKGDGNTIIDHSGNGNHGTFGAISGDTTAFPTWEFLGKI